MINLLFGRVCLKFFIFAFVLRGTAVISLVALLVIITFGLEVVVVITVLVEVHFGACSFSGGISDHFVMVSKAFEK